MEKVFYHAVNLYEKDSLHSDQGQIVLYELGNDENIVLDQFLASQPYPKLIIKGEFLVRNSPATKSFFIYPSLCLDMNVIYQKVKGINESTDKRLTNIIMCYPNDIFLCMKLLKNMV